MPKFKPGDVINPVDRTVSAGAGTTDIAGERFGTEGPRSAPTVDTAAQEIALRGAGQTRAQQLEAIDLTRSAALGEAPSAAEMQQKAGIEQGLRQQLAMASSARGGSGAGLGAIRGAQDVSAQMTAQGAQAGSALRAQEMAAARGMLGSQLSGMQTQDQALAAQQLQVGLADQGAQLTQTGMDDARMIGLGGLAIKGAGQEDQLTIGQQGLQLQGETSTANLLMEQEIAEEARRQAELSMWLGAATGGLMGGATLGAGGGK